MEDMPRSKISMTEKMLRRMVARGTFHTLRIEGENVRRSHESHWGLRRREKAKWWNL